MKSWKPFNDECPRCGNNPVDVFTGAKEDFVYDGDNVECFECGLCGSILVDEDDEGMGIAHVVWNDYEDED
jgi:hypothetical protein